MKIAKQAPEMIKSPVELSKDEYALWYTRPTLLGTIKKQDKHWYTSNGMRFVSSRNALDYLLQIREMVEKQMDIEARFQEVLASHKPHAQPKYQKRRAGASTKAEVPVETLPTADELRAFLKKVQDLELRLTRSAK